MTDISDCPKAEDMTRPLYAVICHSPDIDTKVAYGYGRKHANEMADYMSEKVGGAWRIFKASADD